MGQQISNARKRAWARQMKREAQQKQARRRLLAAGGSVFVIGVLLGLAGGFYFGAPSSEEAKLADIASGATIEQPGPAAAGRSAGAEADRIASTARPSNAQPPLREMAEADAYASEAPAQDSRSGETDSEPPVAAFQPAPETDMDSSSVSDKTSPPSPRAAAAWERNAIRTVRGPGGDSPRIAIVIDDLGLNRSNAWAAIDLPTPLTLAFMTYAPKVEGLTEQARAAGHELMVHVPMQPNDPETDPGPKVLRSGLSHDELLARLTWGLSRFPGYVGINNHMGSAFTADRAGMDIVAKELRRRGLLFLDSVTAAETVAGRAARQAGVPYTIRDVFLDNERDEAAIRQQLAVTERLAREQGYAVAIGHPHDETIAVLRDWLQDAPERGFTLVPISALVQGGRGGKDIARLDGQTSRSR